MCPIAFLVCLTFSFLGFTNALSSSAGVKSQSINVTECFKIESVNSSLAEVNECYHDVFRTVLNDSTTTELCGNITDLKEKHINLMNASRKDCPGLTFENYKDNLNTSVTDILEHVLDAKRLVAFKNDSGFKCLRSVREEINECRNKTIRVKKNRNHYTDNTTFVFWKRTMFFTLNFFNCEQQSKFWNCSRPIYETKCGNISFNFINSTFNILREKCRLVPKPERTTQRQRPNVPVQKSSASYWVVGVLLLVAAVIGIVVIYIRKQQNAKKLEIMEMN